MCDEMFSVGSGGTYETLFNSFGDVTRYKSPSGFDPLFKKIGSKEKPSKSLTKAVKNRLVKFLSYNK